MEEQLVGVVLGETYRVEQRLGGGGMGAVYGAINVRTGRPYAVKVLRPEMAGQREALARFEREAMAVSSIGHAGIVAIHDFNQTVDGLAYIVMDRLEGEDLDRRLRRVGALHWPATSSIFDQTAQAVAAAHALGIIHRDLKPANIFLARTPGAPERPVILDFGLAKMLDDEMILTTLTASGMVMGTPQYMSPEQAQGDPVDHRTDIYALGTILFEMVSGHTPFEARTPAALFAKLLTTPAPPVAGFAGTDMPAGLDAVLGRALAKAPSDRFESVEALRIAVRAIEGASSSFAMQVAPDGPTAPGPSSPPTPHSDVATGPTMAATPLTGLAPPTPHASYAAAATPPTAMASVGSAGASHPQSWGSPAATPTVAAPPASSRSPLRWILIGGAMLLLAGLGLGGGALWYLLARQEASPPAYPPPQTMATTVVAPAPAPIGAPIPPPAPTPPAQVLTPPPIDAPPPVALDGGPAATRDAAPRKRGPIRPKAVEADRPPAKRPPVAPPGKRPEGLPPGMSADDPIYRASKRIEVSDYQGCLRILRSAGTSSRVLGMRFACANSGGDSAERSRTCRLIKQHHPRHGLAKACAHY